MGSINHFAEIQGKRYLLSDEHYLLNTYSWDHEIRDYIAQKINIPLSPDHVEVLEIIRKSYKTRKKHPYVRVVTADMAEELGPEKGTMQFFYSLFPKGIHQAFQIAGLPMQGFCF